MTLLVFSGLLFFGALTAGLLGALTGLGGGVVLVPLLTVFFHVDIRYAIGVSLDFGDCDVVGSRGRICARGVFERADRDVS